MLTHITDALSLITKWNPELTKLLIDLIVCITSSPILARFDSDKPTFLTTNWSRERMGWLLIQPSDDLEYIAAM